MVNLIINASHLPVDHSEPGTDMNDVPAGEEGQKIPSLYSNGSKGAWTLA